VVLSEAFTLSLQRIARIDATSLKGQRCNDSVNASLSAAFIRAIRPGRNGSHQPRRVTLHRRHGAQRIPPNKQMQRARTGYKCVLCLAHRRVADLQRSAATMRYRALSDSASTRAEESDSESAESRQKR
jgi:hypothetical protein